MSKLTLISLALVAATFAVTSADVLESEKITIKAAVIPVVQECAKELGISEQVLLAAKESENVDTVNSCFFDCFFKKIGFLNENGQFDATAAIEKSSQYVSGDINLQKITAVANTCSAVNDQADGCDRAKLLLNCFLKEKYALLSA